MSGMFVPSQHENGPVWLGRLFGKIITRRGYIIPSVGPRSPPAYRHRLESRKVNVESILPPMVSHRIPIGGCHARMQERCKGSHLMRP